MLNGCYIREALLRATVHFNGSLVGDVDVVRGQVPPRDVEVEEGRFNTSQLFLHFSFCSLTFVVTQAYLSISHWSPPLHPTLLPPTPTPHDLGHCSPKCHVLQQ